MTPLPLDGTGLRVLGHCPLDDNDGLPQGGGALVLIGPDEPEFWHVFSASTEYADGKPDPLDRWSKRVLEPIAQTAGGVAYFPSDGSPFRPFYTWALRTGRVWASPIGFLVDGQSGLWVSFRGAIWLPETHTPAPAATQPCLSCDAPCMRACPVDALIDGYDVATCKAHITGPDTADCMISGCAARRACPVSKGLCLPTQAEFHMRAFV